MAEGIFLDYTSGRGGLVVPYSLIVFRSPTPRSKDPFTVVVSPQETKNAMHSLRYFRSYPLGTLPYQYDSSVSVSDHILSLFLDACSENRFPLARWHAKSLYRIAEEEYKEQFS